jgi:hypothetical protein
MEGDQLRWEMEMPTLETQQLSSPVDTRDVRDVRDASVIKVMRMGRLVAGYGSKDAFNCPHSDHCTRSRRVETVPHEVSKDLSQKWDLSGLEPNLGTWEYGNIFTGNLRIVPVGRQFYLKHKLMS